MRSIGARFKAMPGVVDFRNYAEACARLAKSADTDASKTTLLKMAERWTALAVQADRIKQLVREADAVLQKRSAAHPRLSKEIAATLAQLNRGMGNR